MAAELSFRNGRAEMLFVDETPWHGEGRRFDRQPTWAELLEVVDYDLEKRPYFMPAAVAGGPMVESAEAYYVQRTDTGARFGTVGAGYQPIPNREAFEALRPLIDGGVMSIETAGVLRGGADAWLLGRWDLAKFGPQAREVFSREGDEIAPYATVMANHSGRRAILMGQTPIRIVCANTLGAAERGAEAGQGRWASIHHTASGKLQLVAEAERLFAGVVERYEVIAAHYRAMQGRYLTEAEFRSLVLDPVVPDPREARGWNPESMMAESVVKRFERKRDELRRLWTGGMGHTGEPTAWFAYQAVAEALDHNKDLWPVRSGCYRTAQLLSGSYGELKNRLLDRLVEVSLSA